MEETKWKKKIKKKPKNLENKKIHFQEESKTNSVDIMNNKIKKVFDKNKGFSKLPILDILENETIKDNIESLPLKDEYNLGKSKKTIKEPFTDENDENDDNGRDFADIELENELIKLGLKKPKDEDNKNTTNKKKDPHCDAQVPDFVQGQLVRKIDEMPIWKIETIEGNNATIVRNDSDGNEMKEETNIRNLENAEIDISFIGKIPKYFYAGYIYLDYIIKKTAITFSNIVSNNEAKETDIRIIVNEMYKIIFLLFISFITFNWFFVFFYKDKSGFDSNFTTIDYFINKIKSNSLSNFFIGLSTFPITFINGLFTTKTMGSFSIPNIKSFISSNLLIFIGLFLFIYTSFTNLNKTVSLMAKGSGWFGYVVTLLLIVSITNWTFEEPKPEDKELHWSLRFLRWLFKTLITFVLYTPICMFFNLYFIYYSLFPRFTYNEGFSDITNNIFDQIFPSEDDKVCEIENECKSFLERVIIYLKKILRFLLEHLNTFLILFILLLSLNTYNSKLENERLKIVLNILINSVLLLSSGVIISSLI